MSLKPQDVCVLLKILTLNRAPWSYSQLAYELGMSASEVHAAVKRATDAALMQVSEGWGYPDLAALEEFLVHGLRYAFAPERSGLTSGIPTAHAAPPLNRLLNGSHELPPVWPDEQGPVRGYGFLPLYKSVPFAARRDSRLYELLALVDAIRGGGERERALAIRELKARLDEGRAPGRARAGGNPQPAAQQIRRGRHGKES